MRGRDGNCGGGYGGGGGGGGGGVGVGEIALRNHTGGGGGGNSVIGRTGSSGTTSDGANSMKGPSMIRGGSSASSTVGDRRLTAAADPKSLRVNASNSSKVAADAGAVYAGGKLSVHRGFSEIKIGLTSSFTGNREDRSNNSSTTGMRSNRSRSSHSHDHACAASVLANHATSRTLNHLRRVSISPNSRIPPGTVSSFASNTNGNSQQVQQQQSSGGRKIATPPPPGSITSSTNSPSEVLIPQSISTTVAACMMSGSSEKKDNAGGGGGSVAAQAIAATVQARTVEVAESLSSSSRSAYYPQPHPGLRGAAPAANYISREWMKGPSDSAGSVVNASDRPSLCMSVRGTEACIGSADHALYIIDCQERKFLRTLYGKQYGHTEWVTCVDYLQDGRILSGGMDSKLCLWDKKVVRCHDLKGHTASISAVKAGAEGSLAVSSSYDKTLMLWDLSRLQLKSVACLKGHKGAVMGFALSSQGSIVSGSREGEVILWDAARATALLHCKNAHEGHVTALECLEDNTSRTKSSGGDWKQVFLTGGQDGILQVWDFRAKPPVQSVALHRYVFCFMNHDHIFFSPAAAISKVS